MQVLRRLAPHELEPEVEGRVTHSTVKVETACERYLAWIADTKRGMRKAQRDRDEMRSVIDGIKAVRYDRDGAGVQQLHGDDRMVEIVTRLAEIDERMANRLEAYAFAMGEWSAISMQLPAIESEALELHYVDGMCWEDVAQRLAYSERNIYRIRLDALYDLYELLPQGWQ